MSKVLERFLDSERKVNGNDSALSDAAPIVTFAIKLLDDPVMAALTGEQLLTLKEEMAEIPALKGFLSAERDLYFRYSEAKKNGFKRIIDGKEIKLTRVSKATLKSRYRVGLRRFFGWAIENKFAQGPVPEFSFTTVNNPGKAKRDAFRHAMGGRPRNPGKPIPRNTSK